jgi:signal transduction histidine kinase
VTTGATFTVPESGNATVLGLLKGVGVFRLLALIWALVGIVPSRQLIVRPWLAIVLVGAMVVCTIVLNTWLLQGRIERLVAPWVIGVEFVVGWAAMLGDGWVFEPGRQVALAWAWPAAAVMTLGITRGWFYGFPAAAAILVASFVAETRLGTEVGPILAFSRTGLWAATGILAGYVSARLRRAETEVALARAREEVARQLHDGVLQTLAVIQRRSDDAELAGLAREQEAELRHFLSSGADRVLTLEPELRRLAARFQERNPDVRVQVVVAPDVPQPEEASLRALSGAVAEALTNVGKHAAADSVTLFAEPADPDDAPPRTDDVGGRREAEVFVSVRDDGRGFDPDLAPDRIGLARSVRGRVEEVGGTVEIVGRPGRGTEIKLWV